MGFWIFMLAMDLLILIASPIYFSELTGRYTGWYRPTVPASGPPRRMGGPWRGPGG